MSPKLLQFCCDIVAKHNWIFVSIFVPISLAFDLFNYVLSVVRTVIEAIYAHVDNINHEERLRRIQSQLKTWRELPNRKLLCTARPSWKSISIQPMAYKDKMHKISIDLPNILSMDEEKGTVRVEPMVTIGQLNDYLMNKGFMLPVVPELDDLTIGGLVMGGGIETTSHKYGLISAICMAYEMIMPDGSVLWCDKDNHQKLFLSIPFSYGTLGFLTAVDIKIVKYMPYVKHTYIPVSSVDEAVKVFERETNNSKADTVEGILFSRDEGVIMRGTFVESLKEEDHPLNRIGRWYKVYFYKHVENVLKKKEVTTEYIPTWDYFHRHNKGLFWMANYVESSTQHPLFRYLFGWTRPSKFALLKCLRNSIFKEAWNPVLQDYMIRIEDLNDFIELAHETIQCYPLWLCPVRHTLEVFPKEVRHLVSEKLPKTVIVDVGIYGDAHAPNYDKVSVQRKMEKFCIDRGGFVALYAETFLTKQEFTQMFDVQLKYYHELRNEYGLEGAFPESYDKISSASREDINHNKQD